MATRHIDRIEIARRLDGLWNVTAYAQNDEMVGVYFRCGIGRALRIAHHEVSKYEPISPEENTGYRER
jgi:hypothetical protein